MAFSTNKCLLAALTVITLWASHAASRSLTDMPMMEKHEQWMAQYGRVHKDAAEKEHRFKIFQANVQSIESFNAGNHNKYMLGTNQFADLTNEEFRAMYTGFKPSQTSSGMATKGFKYNNVTAVPASMDWGAKGAVTPIKDQGQCGKVMLGLLCCGRDGGNHQTQHRGAHLSIGAIEVVDCDTKGEDEGCNGGLMDDAFEFIIKNGVLTTEANYPYTAADGTCNTKKSGSHAATISGYEDVPANSEAALLKAAANQPVSVAIDASGFAFQFYAGGVFTGDCGTDLDHAVTAVGYGTTSDGTKYWLMKNSWGSSWGEKGYITMERDVDAEEGLCGIAMEASYPTA